jgi:uncharacterized protein YndB with AHSA1/START domain
MRTSTVNMTQIQYEEDINAPVERVYEYYTNPDNIKEAWPRDVVKESESTTTSKNEPGSEMKVKGEYMGRQAEMHLEVADKQKDLLRGGRAYKNFKEIITGHM